MVDSKSVCFIVGLTLLLIIETRCSEILVEQGDLTLVYDPYDQTSWYINDHCFTMGPGGVWHMYGITHTDPADPEEEVNKKQTKKLKY